MRKLLLDSPLHSCYHLFLSPDRIEGQVAINKQESFLEEFLEEFTSSVFKLHLLSTQIAPAPFTAKSVKYGRLVSWLYGKPKALAGAFLIFNLLVFSLLMKLIEFAYWSPIIILMTVIATGFVGWLYKSFRSLIVQFKLPGQPTLDLVFGLTVAVTLFGSNVFLILNVKGNSTPSKIQTSAILNKFKITLPGKNGSRSYFYWLILESPGKTPFPFTDTLYLPVKAHEHQYAIVGQDKVALNWKAGALGVPWIEAYNLEKPVK